MRLAAPGRLLAVWAQAGAPLDDRARAELPPRPPGRGRQPAILAELARKVRAKILDFPASFYGYDARKVRQPRREARIADARMLAARCEHLDLAAYRGEGGANALIGEELPIKYLGADGERRHVVAGVRLAETAKRAGISLSRARRSDARLCGAGLVLVRQKSVKYFNKKTGLWGRHGFAAVRELDAAVIDRVGLRETFEAQRSLALDRRTARWTARKVSLAVATGTRERSTARRIERASRSLADSMADRLERLGLGRPPDR